MHQYYVILLWILFLCSTRYSIIATLRVVVKTSSGQVAARSDDWTRVTWRIPLGMLENDLSSCMPGTFWTLTVCVFTSCIQSWRSLFIAAVWLWVTYSSFQFTVLCGVASRLLFSGKSETSPPFKGREASGWSLQKPKSPWIRTRWAWKVVLMWCDRYYWFLWQMLYLSLPGFIFCMIFTFLLILAYTRFRSWFKVLACDSLELSTREVVS